MKKYELTTFLSEAFKYIVYVIGIGFIGFMTYCLIIRDLNGSLVCLFLILFWYLASIRKIRKFENITFDSKNIYIENQSFSLKEIKQIEKGKIVLEKNGKEENHFWNHFYGKNYSLLKTYHKNEIENFSK